MMTGHAALRPRRWIVATLPQLALVAMLWLPIGQVPALTGSVDDAGARDPRVLSLQPIAENPSWQNDIINSRAGNGGYVYPISVTVLGQAAQVDNPTGLMAAGGGVTTIHATGPGQPALVLDLGVNTGGYVQVGLTGGDGTPVLLAYAEAQRFLTPMGDGGISPHDLNDAPDCRSDLITSTVGPLQLQSPGIRGAERWVLLQLQGIGTVSIDYVRVHVTHYQPSATDYTGHFLSNDDQINRLWYASVYTDNLATTRDDKRGGNLVVMDAGKRDRMVFPGDLGMEGLTDYYSVAPAPQIMHDSLYMFACQQQQDGSILLESQINVVCPPGDPGAATIPVGPVRLGEYTAWYIVDAYDYYLYTGDEAFISTILPVLRRSVQFLANNAPRGLYFGAPGEVNWHPSDTAYGESSNANAVYYEALRDMATLERQVAHDEAAAAADDQQAAHLRSMLMGLLWDSNAGAFRVSTMDPYANHPQDGNVQAVVAGLLDRSDATRALNYVRQHLYSLYGPLNGERATDPFMSQYISPYTSSWELWARFQQHDEVGAMDLLRREYGHMVDTDPEVTMWEKMGPDGDAAPYVIPPHVVLGRGITSLAHGWGSGPASALSAYVLGIRPTAPGYSSWIVDPQPADLQYAQGQAPTPNGPIISRWERAPGDGSFRLTVQGPGTLPGTVAIPQLGSRRTIAEDGAIVWQDGTAVNGVQAQQRGDYVYVANVSGAHTFAWGSLSADLTPMAGGTPTTAPAPTTTPTATLTTTPVPAAIAITPATARPLQTITVTGTTFSRGERVSIYWDGMTTAPLTTTTTGPDGSFVTRVAVPPTFLGPHLISAVGQSSGSTVDAVVECQPQLVVWPYTGPAGTRTVVRGLGFGRNEVVEVFGGAPPGQLLGTTTANAMGGFYAAMSITATIPLSATGIYPIYAVGQSSFRGAYTLFIG